MDETILKLKKNIFKNFIYFLISFVLLIFFVIAINFESLSKIYNILDEVKFTNSHLKENLPQSLPYSYNFFQDEKYIQSENNGLSQSFESKVRNFLANLYALGGDFDSSKENLSDNDWFYYFNKGNVELLDSYKRYGSGNLEKFEDYKNIYSQLGQSIADYNSSAMILGTGDKNSIRIINNRDIAYQMRFLIGAEGCVNGYVSYTKKFDSIISQIESLVTQFEKEISDINDFQKNLKDKSLQDCLKQINKSLNESKINLQTLQTYMITYKNQATKQMSGLVLNPDQCIAKLDEDGAKIDSAAKQISDGLQSFEKINSQIGDILKNKDEKSLSQICNGGGDQGDQNSTQNINDGLSKLDDALGDDSQKQKQQQNGQNQQQDEQNSQDQQGQGQQQENQNSSNSDEPMHTSIPEGYEKQLMQNLEDNSKSWINQMNKLRGDQGYDVKNYINQLFQGFYGNDKDFTNQRGGTGMQYNNGY